MDILVSYRLMKAKKRRFDHESRVKVLLDTLACIPVSTAECERAFSAMNTIVSVKRNRLSTCNVSSLIFINMVGPPLTSFNPARFSKKWLKRGHHDALDNEAQKRRGHSDTSDYKHIYI